MVFYTYIQCTHVYMVICQGFHIMYGHIRCMYAVLANPIHQSCCQPVALFYFGYEPDGTKFSPFNKRCGLLSKLFSVLHRSCCQVLLHNNSFSVWASWVTLIRVVAFFSYIPVLLAEQLLNNASLHVQSMLSWRPWLGDCCYYWKNAVLTEKLLTNASLHVQSMLS